MDNIETLLAAVAQTQGFDDDDEPVVSTAPEQGLENSESSPMIPGDARPSAMVDMPPTASTPVFPAAGRLIGAGERRKRGRPPKGRQAVKLPPTKRNKPEDEEEDVCFICFDGGSLVLCDRKGCPKAYHPACIKRDEAFFKSKAKWNCGWHICSVCRKTSYYMCYTCTYSLCKGCTKDADYLRVRGNKGFCSTCMKTIMLIENKDQANNEIQVDFDDETSWEYLFKVYWVILKEKLSLTLCDLARAKKPWKGVATVGYKPMPSNVIPTAVTVEVTISHSRTEHLELNKPLEEINNENGGDGPEKSSTDEAMQETNVEKATDEQVNEKNQDDLNAVKDTEWASKELLEFVAIVKNGDVSAMSRFDVQTLLLDYVNRNGLWDTRRKSRIICDPTLEKLFGKKRVGHVEMLKLLESHFLVKEDSQKNIFIPAGFVSSVESDVEVDESEEDMGSGDNSKRDEYANAKPSYLDSPQNGSRPISPNNEGKEEKPVEEQNITNETTGTAESNSSDKQTYQDNNITHLATDDRNTQKDMQTPGLEASTATASVGNSPSSNFIEIEKLWHYRDPDGKIRGPFSMMQLREWSTTGLYLPDMRIWTNHEQYDSLCLSDALSGKFHGASDFSNSGSREEGATGEIGVVSEGTNVSGGDSKQIETTTPSNVDVLSEKNNTGVERADEPGSWPQCWDFLKDDNNNNNNKNNNNNVHSRNLLSSSNPEKENEGPPVCGLESNEFYRNSQNGEKNSTGFTQSPIVVGREVQNQANNEGRVVEENLGSLNIDLSSNGIGLSKSPDSDKQGGNIPLLDFPSPARPNIAENGQSFGFLELLTRPNNEDQAGPAIETKNSGFLNFSMPNSGQMWNSGLGAAGGVQIPDLADDWCKFPTGFSLRPPEITDSHHQLSPSQSNVPNWLANINEPIEFDALGEEYVSDLLAEVDAMESQGPLHSPNSAIKFAREFLEDCKDDCFSSIEEFSSSAPDPRRSDALSSTSETQLNFTSCSRPIGRPAAINAFDSLTRSNVHSSASSEGETNNNNNAAPNAAQDVTGGGASSSMGSINLVTVQGNVNLVLGGPAGQGMANIGWGSPNLNHGPVNGSLLPWDGQRGYSGERYTSPREWVGGYQGGRPPWGRQQPPLPYGGGGGYPRPVIPKGQRVCKFYESGRCKKGAFCDYLHP